MFTRKTVVVMGEPPAEYKSRVHSIMLEEKKEQAEKDKKRKGAELERKRLLAEKKKKAEEAKKARLAAARAKEGKEAAEEAPAEPDPAIVALEGELAKAQEEQEALMNATVELTEEEKKI